MKKVLAIGFGLAVSSAFGQFQLGWNSQIQGNLHDDCRAIDLQGSHIYTTGRIEDSVEFNLLTVFSEEISTGGSDVFVAKQDLQGNYIWIKTFGGTSDEQGVELTTDSNGNSYVAGFFEGTFDVTTTTDGVVTMSAAGDRDIFITKVTTDGDFEWIKQISGTDTEQLEGLSVASDGIYVSGRFKGSVDFDPSAATEIITSNGNNDLYVAKLDLAGGFLWAKGFGSNGGDISWGNTNNGTNVLVTGVFKNTVEFEPGNAASSHTSAGNNDIFLLNLDSDGNYVWSKSIGGTDDDAGTKVQFDNSGNILLTGYYSDVVDFNVGAGDSIVTATGLKDAYLLKMDANGDFIWVRTLGSDLGDDKGKNFEFTPNGNIYWVGTYTGTISAAGSSPTSNGATDCFMLMLDSMNTEVNLQSYGSVNDDFVNGIQIDTDLNVYLDGKFSSSMDVDPSGLTATMTSQGDHDGYVVKWDYIGFLDIDKFETTSVNTFPNPVVDVLNIQVTENIETIQLFNVSGQAVNVKLNSKNGTTASINMAGLNAGIYVLKVNGNTTKLIKK